jgi:hypothetical protein
LPSRHAPVAANGTVVVIVTTAPPETGNLRFRAATQAAGSDAMTTGRDYSASYSVLRSDSPHRQKDFDE